MNFDPENSDVLSDSVAGIRLSEREMAILHLIGVEGLTGFTFDGVKRKLGLHPETLSRTLLKLEYQGIVEKAPEGYKVTSKANELLRLYPLSAAEPHVPLVETLLPRDVAVQQVVSNLRGKWFGTLRWLGYSENDDGIVLKWVTEDGGIQVDAKFSVGALNIEAKLREGKEMNEAVRASHQLIGYVARLYSRPQRTRRVAYYVVSDQYTMFT